MSSLAAATLARAGVSDLVIANRTVERAERLARQLTEQGTPARAISMAEVRDALADADLVVSCTGATGLVLTADDVRAAAPGGATAAARPDRAAEGADGPRPTAGLALLDLAMPRDVDQAVHGLDDVHLVDIESLAAASADAPMAADVDAVRAIVSEEVAAFGAAQRAARITPTVVALRTMAADVVAGELARLDGRLPGLDAKERAEITQTVRRVVDKLLHAPTVRVKQLAGEPGGAGYADALRELFDLDPQAVAAVSRPGGGRPGVPQNRIEGGHDTSPIPRTRAERHGRTAASGDAASRRRAAPLRLGTRRSTLAMAQSGMVAGAGAPGDRPPVELVEITTYGDVSRENLAQIGGTGVFVSALREALLAGEVDFAVHSLKDLPTAAPGGPRAGGDPAPRGPAGRAGGPRRPHLRTRCRPARGSAPARRAVWRSSTRGHGHTVGTSRPSRSVATLTPGSGTLLPARSTRSCWPPRG